MTYLRFLGAACAAAQAAFCAAADAPLELRFSGRVLYDYTQAESDKAPLEIDGAELRAARLVLAGKGKQIDFKIELETDEDGEISATDAYIDFALPGSGWTVRAGQFKTPNSLQEQVSGLFTTFSERAAFTDAFAFDRRLGIAATTMGESWTFTAGAFGGNVNDTPTSEGFALAARGTYAPVATEDLTVHLGASVRHRETDSRAPDLRYRQRPFARIAGRMISTGPVSGSDVFVGLEGAVLRGPLWVSAEYGALSSHLTAGGNATFDGSSAEAGYFLGGRRTYGSGEFGRPEIDKPVTRGGPGALSISAAFDTLNLTDSGIDGGTMNTALLGLSWYPTARTRLGLSLFHADADLGTSTSGLDPAFAAGVLAGQTSDKVTGFTLRMQADF
ncbi:porin [Hyphomonas sp.]|uniref:OprO/OprP family phosphate-selective porin n=1 Tax=Hyphomonas sp. TaxID=87 RepID=UPI0032EFF568